MLRFLGPHWTVHLARALAALWAGFWIWFGLASGIGEGLTPLGVLIHTATPGLLFGLLLALVWRFGRAGGPLLLITAVLVAAAYPLLTHGWPRFYGFILLTMALPPLIAGALLAWYHRHRSRR